MKLIMLLALLAAGYCVYRSADAAYQQNKDRLNQYDASWATPAARPTKATTIAANTKGGE